MNNFFTRLAHWLRSLFRREELLRIEIDRPLQKGEWVRYARGVSLFKRPEPIELVPVLSKEHEDAVLKMFETRKALNDELTIDNYWAAWLAEFEAKQYVPSNSNAVKEGLDAIYPNEEGKNA